MFQLFFFTFLLYSLLPNFFWRMFFVYKSDTFVYLIIPISGYMSLLLPTWQLYLEQKPSISEKNDISSSSNLSYERLEMERLTNLFTTTVHWELSTTITSNHLLTIIALANTLMSMNNASFVAEQERNRKLQRYKFILQNVLVCGFSVN